MSFFVDDEGRRPTAQQRVMALVRAAFEALERSGWVAESLAAREAANDAARRPSSPVRLFKPRQNGSR